MPVRSLNSSVLKWPDRETVGRKIREWAGKMLTRNSGVVGIAVFGSYAERRWGVGSDLDIVVLLDKSADPFAERSVEVHEGILPVPADILIYTIDEWKSMKSEGRRLVDAVEQNGIWIYKDQKFDDDMVKPENEEC